MDEQDPLETVAEGYREEGYEVLVRPTGSALPAFLEDSDVDILARKGEQLVALTLKKGEDSSDPEETSILLTANLDGEYGKSLLAEAERLLSPDTLRAAFLMGWAALESAARETLRLEADEADKLPPRALIEALTSRGFITREESERLRECLSLRNMVVHGVRPADLPPGVVTSLLEIARRLLKVGRVESGIHFNATASATLYRSRLNQANLMRLAEQSSEVLREVLGSMRASVSEEWDLAEDAQGQPMVTLKLSDASGKVVATFEPSELEDEQHMSIRLNRLWSDLLRIRSHDQLRRLMAS